MNLLIISRSESKLREQQAEITAQYVSHHSLHLSLILCVMMLFRYCRHKVEVRYLTYDFSKQGEERQAFYAALNKELDALHADGGISLLINNVGIANVSNIYHVLPEIMLIVLILRVCL